MHLGDARELAVRKLEEAVHPVVDFGALRGGRQFLARQDLRHVGFGDVRGAREVSLVQLELFQPLSNDEGHVHLNRRLLICLRKCEFELTKLVKSATLGHG